MSLQVNDKDRQRLLSFIAIAGEDNCWNWTGALSGGTPKWAVGKSGLSDNACKAMYQLFKGEIPEGRRVTRTCGNRICCNPKHLVTDVERFLSKVNTAPGLGIGNCHLWTDHIKASGYGEFRATAKNRVQAHRFAYELTNGSIPDEMLVLHRCDVRACVNPSHLFVGTQADNIHDMMQKNRDNFVAPPPLQGSQNKAAKLTEEQVAEIRQLLDKGFTYQAIMDAYHISKNTVYNIKARANWKHVK